MARDDLAADDAAAAAALMIDPDRSTIVLAVGTKGSGKSEALRLIFDEWPYDRLVIDATGDARPDDVMTMPLAAPFPATLPEPEKDAQRVTVWARADGRSPTFIEDQDNALSMGLFPRHRPVLVWVDEYALLASASNIPPNVRLALQSSRHHALSMLLACPRPMFIPVLTIAQADKIFIFRTPNPKDRERIADNMGYPPARFEIEYQKCMARGEHSFLLWDARQRRLFSCPPLPIGAGHGPRA